MNIYTGCGRPYFKKMHIYICKHIYIYAQICISIYVGMNVNLYSGPVVYSGFVDGNGDMHTSRKGSDCGEVFTCIIYIYIYVYMYLYIYIYINICI
jgi:hypothetical protein